jgi:hypothetical protein
VAVATRWGAEQLRVVQSGQVQVYGAAILVGVVAAIAGILIINPP